MKRFLLNTNCLESFSLFNVLHLRLQGVGLSASGRAYRRKLIALLKVNTKRQYKTADYGFGGRGPYPILQITGSTITK